MKEVFSVASWIAGFIFAFRHAADVGQVLPITSFGPVGRTAAGAVIVILVTLAAFAIFGSLLRLVIKAVSGGVGDGALGFIFGFIRGAVIVMAGVFVASFTSSPESRMWQQSELIPYAEKGLVMCRPLMPEYARADRGHREKAAGRGKSPVEREVPAGRSCGIA